MLLKVFVSCLATLALAAEKKESLVSKNHNVEPSHSLSTPMLNQQVFWAFGGSSVLTDEFLRLTPSAQDNRGWSWNEYPIESENFEVELTFKIESTPHFGGDGLGFWILHGDQDPAFSKSSNSLMGSVFGLRPDFKGFGVVIDVYDNDGKRNNPKIFVLDNLSGEKTIYNHDNDFDNDMLKKACPSAVPLATSCVADVRNTAKPAKILIKYLHNLLHVYVDSGGGDDYKFCLCVSVGEDVSMQEMHLALSAATGQVADQMQVSSISTRLLDDNDKDFDDSQLEALGQTGGSVVSSVFWMGISFGGVFVLGLTAFHLSKFRNLIRDRIDPALVCKQLNPQILQMYIGHTVLCAALLFTMNFTGFLLNIPLLAGNIYQFVKKKHFLDHYSLQKSGGLPYPVRCGMAIANLSVVQLYYFKRLSEA